MIRVKVCGMNNALNVKEIAKSKPDFMGFIFYNGSPRYVGDRPESTLFKNVPSGIKRIGVYFNEENHKILELAKNNDFNIVQLHGSESSQSCIKLRSSGLTVIKAFNIRGDFNFEILIEYMPACDYFLFDTKSEKPGGTGKKFNWEKLKSYSLDKPFFLSGGIGPDDSGLIKTIENRGLYAVDINSRFEISEGIKDALQVSTFIEKLKMTDYEI